MPAATPNCFASATELASEIKAGRLNPVTLTECYLDAIAAHPHGDMIYARTTPKRALAEAQAAQTRAQDGTRLSAFDGIPISWKDLFDSAVTQTEAGSRLLAGRTPKADAEALVQAGLAGWVSLGKTHMSELAFSGLGYNPQTASPPCVNNLDAVSGGSSSGAAASVAFGLAAAAMGSDTGGSIRIPAAWNDLVGFKPSWGKISMAGTVPLCPRFDTAGPLTRTVADAAEMYRILTDGPKIDLAGTQKQHMHLAILRGAPFEEIRSAPNDAFDHAIARLANAGLSIAETQSDTVDEALSLSPKLYAPEAYGLWHKEIEAAPHLMYHEILSRFRGGRDLPAYAFVAAWQKLLGLRKIYQSQMAKFDAILCPTAPILPPDRERLSNDSAYYTTENLLALRNTRIGNLLDLCGVTLPTATPSCGLMLLARAGDERKLLRLAHAVEGVLSSE